MSRLIAFSILVLFVIQGYALEDPSPSKISEYKSLIGEWSKAAKRMLRSIEGRPQEVAEGVSAQLREAMEEGRRQKRSPQDLQNILQGFNDGLKQFMNNVTSSSIYHEMEKIGENINSKGKELFGKLKDEVKKLEGKAD